jgi:hypothetical protein
MNAIMIDGQELAVQTIDDELRIEDIELARVLEYQDAEYIRELIARNSEFLERQGILRYDTGKIKGRGRPRKSYWLNKKQALFIASKSDKPKGAEILLMLVEVFERAQELARREAFEREARQSWVFQKVFLEVPEHTQYLWTPSRLGPISALYGVSYTGGRPPIETKRIQREIYDWIVGSKLIGELRERYPDPPGESGTPYIYDHFHPTVRQEVERQLDHVATLAQAATSRHHFRAMLQSRYGNSMLQLILGGKNADRWSLPPAVEEQ